MLETSFQTLVISRIFRTTPERLFAEWTEPERIKTWWGPKDFSAPVCEIDFREGGSYLLCIRSPSGEKYWSTGIFQKIVTNQQVIATDSYSDEYGNVLAAAKAGLPASWPSTVIISVNFKKERNATRLRLSHKGLPAIMIQSCRAGWNEALDKLASKINNEIDDA